MFDKEENFDVSRKDDRKRRRQGQKQVMGEEKSGTNISG